MVEDTAQLQEHAPTVTSKFKPSSFQPAQEAADPAAAKNSADEERVDDGGEGVDGEPIDDLDGEPIDDLDGEPLDDVDGVPVEDLDVDGVPIMLDVTSMDGDVDGDPMEMEDDIDGTSLDT
jgi:U2-associated protein SR140